MGLFARVLLASFFVGALAHKGSKAVVAADRSIPCVKQNGKLNFDACDMFATIYGGTLLFETLMLSLSHFLSAILFLPLLFLCVVAKTRR